MFQTPIGTRDILAPESTRWRQFVAAFADTVERAGYGQIIPPMFEEIGVFLRLGDSTEIVTKEMYDFEDKGGRRIALRPEQTASVVRAFVQHRPALPWKVWYAGPNFRYEKAQKGRYRQFDQVGVEVLGVDDAGVDVEVITLAWRFYETLGLRQVTVAINSLGDGGDRERYIDALRAYFGAREHELSHESRATLARNPLRVLDSKRAEDASIVAAAPSMLDFLSEGAGAHFDAVRSGLERLRVPYTVTPRLVRGLDYYRRTTFEFVAGSLEGAQNAVGGGGRYDGLVEEMGGPPTPGIGFAIGVDRTLLACDAETVFAPPSTAVDVFVIDTTGGAEALVLTDELRRFGLAADRAYDARSMKAQMKAADRSGARLGLIVGSDELDRGEVTVRDLRGHDQTRVPRHEVAEHVRKLLNA